MVIGSGGSLTYRRGKNDDDSMEYVADKKELKTRHDVFMFADMYLKEYGEVCWFRNERESDKGNDGRAAHYRELYHSIHNVIKELDKIHYASVEEFKPCTSCKERPQAVGTLCETCAQS